MEETEPLESFSVAFVGAMMLTAAFDEGFGDPVQGIVAVTSTVGLIRTAMIIFGRA